MTTHPTCDMCHHMSSHVTQHTNGMCHHTWTNDFTIVILHATARGFVGWRRSAWREKWGQAEARVVAVARSKSGCGGSTRGSGGGRGAALPGGGRVTHILGDDPHRDFSELRCS